MKTVIKALSFLTIVVTCSSCGFFQNRKKSADTIFYHGEIVTVNDEMPLAEAVAVSGGKILFVGSEKEAMEFKGAKTEMVDLQGKTMLPGFIDAHTHMIALQLTLQGLQLDAFQYPTGKDVIQQLTKEVKNGPVLAFRFDPSLMKEPIELNFKTLDAISDHIPIVIINTSGHIGYANQAAFQIAGITNETKNPSGGSYQRDTKGALTGVAFELPAIAPLLGAFPQMQKIDFTKVAKEAATYYSEHGYTTVTDLALGLPTPTSEKSIEVLRAAATALDAPVRIQGYVIYPLMDQLKALQAKNTDQFKVLGIKIWSDGSLQGYTGALFTRYKDRDTKGVLNFTPTQLDAMVLEAHEKGFQVAVHANGDAAIHETLDAYERALKVKPVADPRFRVEHATIADELTFAKMKEVRATPSFSVLHIYEWGPVFEKEILGKARANEIDSAGTAHKLGIPFSINDDTLADLNPLLFIQTIATREMENGKILNPKETISVDEAIKSITIYPAWQTFREKELGTIEVGKFADFVILDQNPKRVLPSKIKTIKVLGTYLNGKSAYQLSPIGLSQRKV